MMTHVLSWILTTLASLAASLALFAQAPVDLKALETIIDKADRDFCRAVADRDVARFRSFIAENATFSGTADSDERGRDEVAKAWAPYFEPGGPTLTWQPEKAEVLAGGDVGYTVGRWERKSKGSDGRVAATHGEYVTVWRKQKDGAWQVVYDTGSVMPGK